MGGLLRPSQHANPAHFIVPNTLSRVRTARITCSVFDRRIPSSLSSTWRRGVRRLAELCLLLEARTAALANLVETGYEFCGRYRLPALPDGNMAPDQLPHDLRAEAAVAPLPHARCQRRRRGEKMPFRTYSRIRNRPKNRSFPCSAAFRDASAATGFPQATLNHPVRISENARGRDVGRICRCDLFWPDAKLDVEYDSRLHHAGEAEQEKDSARRTALAYAGILVITVSSDQLHTRSEMDKVAHAMAKRLGTRCRSRAHDWELKQIRLRSQLLGTTRPEMLGAKRHP